jgi:hypothetical protein
MIWLQWLVRKVRHVGTAGAGAAVRADPLSTAQHRIGPFQRQNLVIC